MSMRSIAWLLCILSMLTPATLMAAQMDQSDTLTAAEVQALAEQYAPVLHFGPGERYFPTVPFFPAFRSTLTPTRPLEFDLAALDDVPLGDVAGDPQVSWSKLDTLYTQTGDRPYAESRTSPAAPAVFYRARFLTPHETHQMWSFLKDDEQAWEREDFARLWPDSLQDVVRFVSIEYYFYYINDNGLEGHPEDIEFVYVFVPYDDTYRDAIRITVGAGHNPRTPNNVLVQSADDIHDSTRVDIIVELGGHASAPDVDPFGEFQIGIDVNWHASEVWGTRDLLAVTGTGFVGAYTPAMTLSRERARSLCPGVARRVSTPEGDSRSYSTSDCRRYQLLAVEPFMRLDSALDARSDVGYEPEWADLLNGLLPSTSSVAPGSVSEQHLRILTAWTRDLCCLPEGKTGGDANRHKVWQHEHYRRDPVEIMKSHLYRPSTVAFDKGDIQSYIDLLVYGGTYHPRAGYELYAGIVVPAPTWLPTRLPGFLELHAGAFTDHTTVWSFAALYDNEYRDYFGWYARLGYIPRRAEATQRPDDADVTISGGLSLLLWSWDDPWLASELFPVNILRLRVGPRLDLKTADELFRHADWEIQLSINR